MKITKPILTLFVFLFVVHTSYGQLDKVKERLENDQNNQSQANNSENSSSYESDPYDSFDDGFFAFQLIAGIVDAVGYTLVETQRSVVAKRDKYPHLFSVELPITFGGDLKNFARIYRPGVKLNWGIFTTDLQLTYLEDYSASLNSWDWQVIGLQFPVEFLELKGAIGFVRLPEFNTSYFESSVGLNFRFPKIKTNINTLYRATARTPAGDRYRQLIHFRVDYELYNYKKLHISPLLEYSYENYFADTEFHFVKIGAMIRFY